MNIEMNEDPFIFKKSKAMMVVFKILIGVGLFLSFLFVSLSIREIDRLLQYNERPDFKDFYLFTPNQDFFLEARKQFPDFTGRNLPNANKSFFEKIFGPLQRNGDVELVIYNLIKCYETENYIIFTYWRPETYDLEYDYLMRQMKAGRWFESGEDGLILLKGSAYKIGDSVLFEAPNKKSKTLTVVGESKGHYLWNTTRELNHYSAVLLSTYHKTVFLLNPESSLNERSNLSCYDDIHTLVKINNPNAIKQIKRWGTLSVAESYATPKSGNQIMDNLFYYIGEYHLYYLLLTLVFHAVVFILLYYLHKWNWQKYRWVFLGIAIAGMAIFGIPEYANTKLGIAVWAFEIVMVIVYDLYLKNLFVHGRSYIVDLWDEEDIEI